jgi:hypothetical protein
LLRVFVFARSFLSFLLRLSLLCAFPFRELGFWAFSLLSSLVLLLIFGFTCCVLPFVSGFWASLYGSCNELYRSFACFLYFYLLVFFFPFLRFLTRFFALISPFRRVVLTTSLPLPTHTARMANIPTMAYDPASLSFLTPTRGTCWVRSSPPC